VRRTKKLLIRIGAAAVVAAAFASAAIAADSGSTLRSSASALSAAASNAVGNVALPAAASQTAIAVIDAIAGGANPSSAASQADPESRAQARANGPSFNLISAAQGLMRAATAGTVGVRPGWGCGDKNHTHDGPPGRPDADPPPGCNR
jgi:hypothetical protein